MPNLYFFYGTLKRGHKNHHWLIKDEQTKLISNDSYIKRHSLVIVEKNIPGLIPWEHFFSVYGEVWQLSPENEIGVDLLEQGYIKTKLTIYDYNSVYEAFTYLWPYAFDKQIDSTAWNLDLERESNDYGNF